MAAEDYHENSFFFKTITFVRIIAGVAVTLAVLFAMVWLIDYSSPRTPLPHRQQPLLVPERADEIAARKPGTFFESLLTRTKGKNAGSADRDGTTPDLTAPVGRLKPPAPVGRSQPVEGVRDSDPSPGSARTEPPAFGLRAALPSTAPEPGQKQAKSVPAPQIPAAGEVFAVQFGSFQQEERARQLSEDLAARGYHPYITTASMPDGMNAHRVRVGRFATREEAMQLAAAIEKTEKISVFVTSK